MENTLFPQKKEEYIKKKEVRIKKKFFTLLRRVLKIEGNIYIKREGKHIFEKSASFF